MGVNAYIAFEIVRTRERFHVNHAGRCNRLEITLPSVLCNFLAIHLPSAMLALPWRMRFVVLLARTYNVQPSIML